MVGDVNSSGVGATRNPIDCPSLLLVFPYYYPPLKVIFPAIKFWSLEEPKLLELKDCRLPLY